MKKRIISIMLLISAWMSTFSVMQTFAADANVALYAGDAFSTITVDEDTFQITLSGNVEGGRIAVALYTDNEMERLKLYPAQETVDVIFDDKDRGDYAKIMWWTDTAQPVCKPVYVDRIPINQDRTWGDLLEMNGEKTPEVEVREDAEVGLFSGVYAEKKVNNASDAVDSLKNMETLLNIGDVDAEFVPFDDVESKIDENTYKVQQVYNGVPVANAQTIISVNEEGYPDSILNRYDDSVRLSGINTTPSISEARAKEIILADLISKDAEYTNGKIESIYLEIQADQEILTYHAYVTCDNSLGFNYYVDAHSGEVVVANEVCEVYNTAKKDAVLYYSNGNNSKINVTNINETTYGIDYIFYDSKHDINVIDMDGEKWSRKNATKDDKETFLLTIQHPINYIDESRLAEREAFYAIYNMSFVAESYKPIFKEFNGTKLIATNVLSNNCSFSPGFSTQDVASFVFGKGQGIENLDTMGHEYTHYFQDYYINDGSVITIGSSLGDGFGIKNSSNMGWVEARAISEGTADIMGMLIESLAGETVFGTDSERFWLYGEDRNGKNPTADHYVGKHFSSGLDAIFGFTNQANKTVSEMKNYYNGSIKVTGYKDTNNNDVIDSNEEKESNKGEIPSNQLRYSQGPGHNDRFILPNAFRKMCAYSQGPSNRDWFKIWGGAIKLLTTTSNFADMRLALIQSANKQGYSHVVESIKKGLDAVGITEAYNADIMIRWYMPYVNRAVEEGVISANETDGFRYNDPVTRAELITMACNYCQIDLSKIKVGDIAIKEHWAAKAVQLGYNYGVLTSRWLNSEDYLNQTVPRWEAANVLFGIMNISEVYHRKTGVWYTSLNSTSYNNFKSAITGDWGVNVFKDEESKLNLLNMNRGYKDNHGVWAVNDEFTDITTALSHFTSQHLWNNNSVDETDNVISYFGLYQLWANDKSYGQEDQGKRWLRIHDQMTRGEVCAILYK